MCRVWHYFLPSLVIFLSSKSAAAERVSSRAATEIWRTRLTAYAVVELRLAWQRGRAHLFLDLACHALRVALFSFFLGSSFFQKIRHSKQRSFIHASREDLGALDGDGVVEDAEEAKCDEPP